MEGREQESMYRREKYHKCLGNVKCYKSSDKFYIMSFYLTIKKLLILVKQTNKKQLKWSIDVKTKV